MNFLQYTNEFKNKVNELVGMVEASELTADEAAQSLAGWELKNNPTVARQQRAQGEQFDHGNLLRKCRVQIDTRLPGFPGLSLDRHF